MLKGQGDVSGPNAMALMDPGQVAGFGAGRSRPTVAVESREMRPTGVPHGRR